MNIRALNPQGRAYTLIELIVYMAVYGMLLGLALICFYRCFDMFFALRRQSDDITRTVQAGEIWRRDVRAATAAIGYNAAEQTLRIPQGRAGIAYRFGDSCVYRRAGDAASWTVFLPRVQSSAMQTEARSEVTAWRWEVELQTKQKVVRMRPVFTFLAAPVTASTP